MIDVIRYLRFLARQGIAIQGNPGDNNFTQLLKLLRTKYPSIHSMLEKTTLKYTHNDIQKKLLELKAQQVLHEKLKEISENNFFAIMGDKYTDISNLEQLSMCLRTVSDNLEIQEDFLGFYELNNINSNSTVHAIKDVLLRSNISLQSCQGQTYDNASNMMGEKSGKSTDTHCHRHSLSLVVKDLTSPYEVLFNTMSTIGEICVLVKYSPLKGRKYLDLWTRILKEKCIKQEKQKRRNQCL